MKPVMQTVLGSKGNCFAACIASLFHLAIEEVPNFVGESIGDDWATPVRSWLRPRGFGLVTIGLNGDTSVLHELEGYVIVAGESVRGLCHATIWSNGKLVHDPHPSQCGILEAQYIDLIYPLSPAALGGTWRSAAMNAPTKAAVDVLAERQRQVNTEGWTPEHDDEHAGGSMALAAAAYAIAGSSDGRKVGDELTPSSVERIWSSTGWAWRWWKPKDRRSNLVRAAALLLAEIERIDRAEGRAFTGGGRGKS